MKKNGFVFIETIVVVVVLTTSLLIIYSSYSSAIFKEKERIYYDDMAVIYKTNYVRKFLEENSTIEYIKNNEFFSTYGITIGSEHGSLFNDAQRGNDMPVSLQNMFETFHINQLILVKKDYFLSCKQKNNLTECSRTEEGISNNFVRYLEMEMIFVAVYQETNKKKWTKDGRSWYFKCYKNDCQKRDGR